MMGVPWNECEIVSGLVGVKSVVNEFFAYQKLSDLIQKGSAFLWQQNTVFCLENGLAYFERHLTRCDKKKLFENLDFLQLFVVHLG